MNIYCSYVFFYMNVYYQQLQVYYTESEQCCSHVVYSFTHFYDQFEALSVSFKLRKMLLESNWLLFAIVLW